MINKQIVFTSIALFCLVILFEFTDIDIWVQDHFYNFATQQWVLDRDEKITKFIFYDGIKKLLIISIVLLLAVLLLFRNSRLIQTYKQGLWVVCLSVLLVPLSIGSLKAITNIPCPNDITRYGGDYPHVTVLKRYPKDFHQTEKIKCYPAGHASGGFALLSLLFLFKSRRNKRLAFVSVMIIGWSMGGYKMLIGDHFLSHTVMTMVLAWLIILLIAKGVYKKFAVQD